ncbi:hypothetical protein AHiyo8_pI68440 (plasmid) [Arthrobacter sp. Hiyo8]|nr:hypothetical protein AHiyo8_pI68440 [Arthrobacter sp. Hiyo8]
MDWAAVWRYIAGGLLIAGAIDAWIPKEWLRAFFFEGNDLLAALWGPIIGPVVALLSFVCSVGNVPSPPSCGTAASASAGWRALSSPT